MERLHHPRLVEKTSGKPVPKSQTIYQRKTISSPIGPITLIANDSALVCLTWGQDLAEISEDLRSATETKDNPILSRAQVQLKEYFSGKRFSFDIPLEPKGTEFQKQVWQQLLQIPYGQHISYGEQAKRVGRPKAARAVGGANGKNPIGIIIPCHRVIGVSGHLTGFAGGLNIKTQLLALEGNQLSNGRLTAK